MNTLKLVVADDVKHALVAAISFRTKWAFGDVVTLINDTVSNMPDMSGLVRRTEPEATVLHGAGTTPPFPGVLPKVSGQETVSFLTQDQEGTPESLQHPPTSPLPKGDTRPVMVLSSSEEDDSMNAAQRALNAHTARSRRSQA